MGAGEPRPELEGPAGTQARAAVWSPRWYTSCSRSPSRSTVGPISQCSVNSLCPMKYVQNLEKLCLIFYTLLPALQVKVVQIEALSGRVPEGIEQGTEPQAHPRGMKHSQEVSCAIVSLQDLVHFLLLHSILMASYFFHILSKCESQDSKSQKNRYRCSAGQ